MPASESLYADNLPGRTLWLKGEEFLFCSGTAYLGIPHNRDFRERLQEGMGIYGTNYSSSRISNLQLQVFEEAEDFLASYTGAAEALTFSSGLLAGQVLVQALQDSGRFIYAPGTHPAVWRGGGDAPESGDKFEEWAGRLPQEVLYIPEQHLVLVCNSLDPLLARCHSFGWLASLPSEKQYTLILDDSHGFGLTGTDGAGIYSQLPHVPHVPHVRFAVVSSLGKALGIPAGVVLGDRELMAELRATPFFGGASPEVPAYLYAFLHSQAIYKEARQRLFRNIAYLSSGSSGRSCSAVSSISRCSARRSTRFARICRSSRC